MKLPGIVVLPKNIKIVRMEGRFVEAVRSDGLHVFFDLSEDEASKFLNKVRLHAPAEVVLRAVGAVRGLQISQNYARMHCNAYDGFIQAELRKLADLFKSNGWLGSESSNANEFHHKLPENHESSSSDYFRSLNIS